MDQEQGQVKARRRAGDYPEDRFDRVAKSGRVGAHRVAPKPRHVWQYLIAGLLGFAILTGIGVLWVQSVGSLPELDLSGPQQTEAPPPVQPKLDPTASVVVLDGSGKESLGTDVDQTITAQGWGVILFSGPASQVAESTVYYRTPNDEAAAAGLAEQLGGLPFRMTDEFGDYEARLIVVLGSDYTGPGSAGPVEAAAAEDPVE